MKKLFKKFLKDQDGAVALETVLLAPILIFGTLGAADLAVRVHTLQSMSNTTRNGIELVVAGSRDADNIRAVMSKSFGEVLTDKDVSVKGYCACVAISEDIADENQGIPLDEQPEAFYVKTFEEVSENMCAVTNCSEDAPISTLIEIKFEYSLAGVFDTKDISHRLQTRVR